MKLRLTLILLFTTLTSVFAQQKDYKITVKLKDKGAFKYVFLYDYNNYPAERKAVTDTILFLGNYSLLTENGGLQSGLVVLSNNESISENDLIYNQKNMICQNFLFEPKVEVFYTGNGFSIRGDTLNIINNIFVQNENLYKKKLDSLYGEIDKKYLIAATNKTEKAAAKRKNYILKSKSSLDIMKKNTNSEVALDNFFVFAMVPIIPTTETRTIFSLFSDRIRKSKYGRLTDSLITVQENMFKNELKIGTKMPVFELKNANDKIVKGNDTFGKYTLIDFWASWCAPCRAENPNLKLAYQKYHKKGFNIISISIDAEKDKAKWLAAIAQDKTQEFINLYNPGGSSGIAKELGINAIPANYLIDGKGIVVGVNLRGSDLQKKLNKLFVK